MTALAPPPAGVEWHILRETPDIQAADYRAFDSFPAELHEAALDRAALRSAETREALSRALRFPRSDPAAVTAELPAAPARGARLLGFDAGGAPALYDVGLAATPGTAGALVGTNALGDRLEEKPGLLSDGTGLTIGGDAVVTQAAVQSLSNKTLESPVILAPTLAGPGGALTLPAGPGEMVVQEAGSWTPTLRGSEVPGTQSYSVQNGAYLRIGALVVAWCSFVMTAKDPATAGNILIAGLPFSSAASTGFAFPSGINVASNINLGAGYSQFIVRVRGSGNRDAIVTKDGSGLPSANIAPADIADDAAISAILIYQTDE